MRTSEKVWYSRRDKTTSDMPVHLAVDARLMHLIEEAERLGQHRTKEEAVKAALDDTSKGENNCKL
jgi:hypothetical protein